MQTSPQSQVTPERLMQFTFGYAPPLLVEAASHHGVFDLLDRGAYTLEQVSAKTGASVRGLRALMNALVGLELLAKDKEGKYSLTPESSAFLVSGKPGYLGGLFHHASANLLPRWIHINEIVRTGCPANTPGQQGDDAQFFSQFVESIFPLSYPAAQLLADNLGVPQATQQVNVLDLAAGSGVWGISLAEKSPQVHVTAVDWPGVIPVTRRVAARFGVSDRFRFVEGDLMEADFGKGHHIATLGHILHSDGEERNRALLRKTFEAMAPGGAIAIADWLVNEDRTGPPRSLLFAVNMLVNTERGDTFSFGEIGGWLRDAGFENVRTLDVPGPSPLILASKPTNATA